MKALNQAVFDEIFKRAREIGQTYASLPDSRAVYPFIVPSYVQVIPKSTSSGLVGRVIATIDMWGEHKHRAQIAGYEEQLFRSLSYLNLDNRRLVLLSDISDFEIMEARDENVSLSLIRGRMTLQFNIKGA